MRTRAIVLLVWLALLGAVALLHAQRRFQQYRGNQYSDFPVPPDADEPHEWIWSRLRYRDAPGGRRGFGFGRGGDLTWSMDYPRCDRHFVEAVRRLTLIDSRSVEQVIDLDGTDDVYNWPYAYAVEVGGWTFNAAEAAQLRTYFDRGGFLLVDDFHGSYEWQVFVEGLTKVFPDREIEDIPIDDPIFHMLYDLDERFQIPGELALMRGVTYEQDGIEPHWRAIRDDAGRIVVAICHNMDLGDAFELSDDPSYPAKYANLAYRVGMNYLLYDLSH